MNQLGKIFLTITAFTLCACKPPRYVAFTGFAQGGTYTVKADISTADKSYGKLADDIQSLLDSIDRSLSGYNKGSLLSRMNTGEIIEPDRFLRTVIELSAEYSELTEGAFDTDSAPLFDIWGFGFTADSLPSQERIDEALKLSAEGKIKNFNAIAQGYTCDVIADYLKRSGVRNMLVDIGEIYCSGLNPRGEGWTISVDTPFDGNIKPGESSSGIWCSDGRGCGIVTSGNYRKFYVKDGKKYAHTIDPRTGYPVTHNLLSATIIAPTAAEADAVATACMVMGPQAAIEFIQTHDEIEGLLICEDFQWTSDGFRFTSN